MVVMAFWTSVLAVQRYNENEGSVLDREKRVYACE